MSKLRRNPGLGSVLAACVAVAGALVAPPATAGEGARVIFSDLIISSYIAPTVFVSSAVAPVPGAGASSGDTGGFGATANGFRLGVDASGRVILDHLVDGSPARRAFLGAIATQGRVRGSVIVGPDRQAWLAFAGDGAALDLYALGEVSKTEPLDPLRIASISVGRDFDPESVRLGIIAILIGLVRAPVPTLSLVDGDVHRSFVWNGTALLPFMEQES